MDAVSWRGGVTLKRYYCPSKTVTRAQAAAFLVRALGEKPVPVTSGRSSSFNDVSKHHWAWGYIEKLKELGITNGCGNGINYCPERKTTRAHTAVFLVRALGQDQISTNTQTFADVRIDDPRTSANEKSWAHGYIEKMQQMKIAVTCHVSVGTRYFCPEQQIRRDIMANFLTTAILTLQNPTPATTTTTTSPPAQPPNARVSN